MGVKPIQLGRQFSLRVLIGISSVSVVAGITLLVVLVGTQRNAAEILVWFIVLLAIGVSGLIFESRLRAGHRAIFSRFVRDGVRLGWKTSFSADGDLLFPATMTAMWRSEGIHNEFEVLHKRVLGGQKYLVHRRWWKTDQEKNPTVSGFSVHGVWIGRQMIPGWVRLVSANAPKTPAPQIWCSSFPLTLAGNVVRDADLGWYRSLSYQPEIYMERNRIVITGEGELALTRMTEIEIVLDESCRRFAPRA